MSGTVQYADARDPAQTAETQTVTVVAAPEVHRERLRVAWVAGPATAEQYGRALQPLAIGLMDELIEIVAVCPSGADVQELPSPPVETVPHGRTRWLGRFTRSVEALARELRRRKVRLLHALDADTWGLAAELGRLAGLNCIVSSYGLGDGLVLRQRRRSMAVALAGSEGVRERLLAWRVVPRERVELVRPGVYHVRKATCFLNPDLRVSIVAGGPMDDFASFEAVVRCFAALKRSGHDCVFFLMGNGRAEQRLRSLTEVLGMRGELTFVDRQPPRLLPEIFKAADIYVAPVPDRCIDMPCLLAMAGGVPVLAAGAGASDFLIDAQTARLFARGNSADLTAKLTALLEDRTKAVALAEGALAHLRAHHSPAGVVTAVTRIYRQVAAMPMPAPVLQSS
ncbi:MAG: glycosyltransferase family 4 protein [Phycisphaerae bacterium]|nr:glycosyltransferase family 4 protein [Phycisphaerae bacterium]